MNIGNITSDNFNLDSNGKDIQIEVYEQLIEQLQQKNKQLKDNWNYIKKMLKEARNEEFNIIGYCGTCTDVDIDFLLNKMQELQGSDSNEI